MASLRLQAALLGLVLALGLGLAPTVAASIPETQGIADDLRSRLSEPRPELDVSEPIRVAGEGASLPETRVRGFRLLDPLSRPGWNGVSRENAAGYAFGLWGNRVGPVQKGLWTDPVTGAAYARARWYDARNGVFLTEDPMGDVDSPNLYAYVAWNPSSWRDPLGTERIVLPPDISVEEAERLRVEDPERFAEIISRPRTKAERRIQRGYEDARTRLMKSSSGRAAAQALENREERLYVYFDPGHKGSLVVDDYQIVNGNVVAASLTIGPDWAGDIPPGRAGHYPYGITLNDSSRLMGVYKVAHEEHGHFILALDDSAYQSVFLPQERFRQEVQDPAKSKAEKTYPGDVAAQGREILRLIGAEEWDKAEERQKYIENRADEVGKELTEDYKESLGFWQRLFL